MYLFICLYTHTVCATLYTQSRKQIEFLRPRDACFCRRHAPTTAFAPRHRFISNPKPETPKPPTPNPQPPKP